MIDVSDGHEVAIKFYEAARNEILQRMNLRDQALNYYLIGVGGLVVFGIKVEGGPKINDFILLIAFISVAAALIIGHHSRVAGELGEFCTIELHKHLGQEIPQWDSAASLGKYRGEAIKWRTGSELLLLIGPPSMALWLTWQLPGPGVWWLLAAGGTVASGWLTFKTAAWRRETFGRIFEDREKYLKSRRQEQD